MAARAVTAALEPVSNAITGLAGEIISGVAWVILKLATWLLAAAGTLLNWVMVKAVFQFSTLIGASPGLLTAWSIMRDIGNMFLLFGFIFIGIATILGLQTYAAQKALPRLIIFAILMNFSLFIAGAVIDTSNGLSAVLYNQTNANPCNLPSTLQQNAQSTEDCSVNFGLAGHIMQATGLQSTYAADNTLTGLRPEAMVGLAMFVLVGAFVFFAAAIMLIIRAVVLAFLMVLAPIGFAALAVPALEKHGKDWWNRLIHQSFFAPIFLVLAFASLKITDSFAAGDTRGSLAAAVTNPNTSTMAVIMIFAMVIGFLIFALIAAKKFGAMGADFAVNTAGKFTAGTMGFVGRQTLGRATSGYANRLRGTRFGQTEMGRRLTMTLDKGGKASYDFRSSGASGLLKSQGLDIGKGTGKGGYAQAVEDKKKMRLDYAKSLRQTKEDKEAEARLNKINEGLESQKKQLEKAKSKEQERWNEEREDAQDQINKLESSFKYDDESRNRALDLQKAKVEEAAKAGNKRVQQREQAELDRLTEKYKNQRDEEMAEIATLKSGLRDREKDHKSAMQTFSDDIEGIDNEVSRNTSKILGGVGKDGKVIVGVGGQAGTQRYAKNLEESRMRTVTTAGRARQQAYNAIKKDLKKSKEERIGDEIKEAIKGLGKDTHDIEEKLSEATGGGSGSTKEGASG